VKPLVLVDGDGVTTLGLFTSARQRGRLTRVEGWQHRWVDRYSGTRVLANPAWGPMLRSLEELGAELAWASTWNDDANLFIAPALGLHYLPVFQCSYDRKALDVIPLTGGRPWAWLDDSTEELSAAETLSGQLWDAPCCPVPVDRATGLTEENIKTVAEWLSDLPGDREREKCR